MSQSGGSGSGGDGGGSGVAVMMTYMEDTYKTLPLLCSLMS